MYKIFLGCIMHDLIRKAINDPDAAWELSKIEKGPRDVIDAVTSLNREEAIKLGNTFKRFPLGCDLTEILVGTCASDLEKTDILGNCMLADSIGASIHVCAYAFADIAEAHGMKGIDLLKEVREITEVPLDLDHFGRYGPMRLPPQIIGCNGQCYNEGPPFSGCPRDRIHSRLLDVEQDALSDRDEWVKISSSVAVNLTCVQGADGHAAPLDEAQEVADLARKYGKGIEAIMFVGDGYDDLIKGFTAALDMGVDVFVLEGGPFNCSTDRLTAFARAVAIARILVPGKIVATNGAYEDECRIGLRAGLNAIITGFPKNHHGYMCGYSPGKIKRGYFGLPRILQIIKEEVRDRWTHTPIQKGELEALARAVKVVGIDTVYPQKIRYTYVGDAHWACLPHTPVFSRTHVLKTVQDIVSMALDGQIGDTVALLGGRFVSWAIAKKLDGVVDSIIISDVDPWIEHVTIDNLRSELHTEISPAKSSDTYAHEHADTSIICSTMPELVRKMSWKCGDAITLI